MIFSFDRLAAMFGDFKEFGPPDGGLAGRGHDHAHGQRSRSPIPSQRNQGAPVQPKLFPEPWSTQHVGLDDSVKNGNYEQATLDKLADVDVKQRQRWIRATKQQPCGPLFVAAFLCSSSGCDRAPGWLLLPSSLLFFFGGRPSFAVKRARPCLNHG